MTEFKNGSAAQWRGVVKFAPDDHELYRLVQKRVALKWKWEQIADEIGCEVKPLVEWVLSYKEPSKLPMVRTYAKITYAGHPLATSRQKARQFEAWRRAHEGAAKTRAENS